MIDEIIDSFVDSSRILLVIIFGGIAMTAIFVVTDQIVHNSAYPPLQNTYQITKPVVTTTSDIQDWQGFAKSVFTLVVLIGGGSMAVWIVRKIDFSDFM